LNNKSVLRIIPKILSFHIYPFFLLQLIFFYNGVLQAQWIPTNGPYGGTVRHLAVNGANIFAGEDDLGAYISSNNGTTWTLVKNVLDTTVVNSIAISGTNIFIGTIFGVFLSTDNGVNWVQVNNGLTYPFVSSLGVNGANIFAGTYWGLIFLSTNNGASWTKLNNDLTYGTFISCIVFKGTDIFLGTSNGIFLSTNNGTSWTDVSNGLPYTIANTIAIFGTNIFVGTDGVGVWRRPLSELVGVTKEINDLPKDFTLSQNFPEPFNPSTTINYSLAKAGYVKLTVYNTIGSKVATIVDEYKPAGNYSVQFNGNKLPSEIYFYKLEAG
jgi:hypothetical protein